MDRHTVLVEELGAASLGNSVIADRAWGGGSEIFRVSRRSSRSQFFLFLVFLFTSFLWVRVFQTISIAVLCLVLTLFLL